MRFALEVLVAATATTFMNVNCFAFSPVTNRHALSNSNVVQPSSKLFMSDPPSDTSSDDILTVDSDQYEPTQKEELVTSFMDQLPTTLGDVTPEARTAINEAILELEAFNPTDSPTMSPLLNGVWELKYAAGYSPDWALPSPTRDIALFLYSGGYSPGLFALTLAQKIPAAIVDVGDLTISISRDQPRIEAKVDVKLFGSAENEVVVKAGLDVESDLRLKEVYESAVVLDNTIAIPESIQYSRDLYVTYLDDDILIVRDASGVPEVLLRKK